MYNKSTTFEKGRFNVLVVHGKPWLVAGNGSHTCRKTGGLASLQGSLIKSLTKQPSRSQEELSPLSFLKNRNQTPHWRFQCLNLCSKVERTKFIFMHCRRKLKCSWCWERQAESHQRMFLWIRIVFNPNVFNHQWKLHSYFFYNQERKWPLSLHCQRFMGAVALFSHNEIEKFGDFCTLHVLCSFIPPAFWHSKITG